MLQSSSDHLDKMNDGGPQFAEVFVIFWVGAVVVTLNTKLLGGNMYVLEYNNVDIISQNKSQQIKFNENSYAHKCTYKWLKY